MIAKPISLPLKLALLFHIASISCTAQQLKIDSRTRIAMNKVDTSSIKSHIWYLADDKLKGRLPGTAGFQLAVDYVTDQFRKMGLQPAGNSGKFTQSLIIRKSTLLKATVMSVIRDEAGNDDSLIYGKDITIQPHPLISKQQLNAGIVFAGYGIEAPSLGINDYENLDVKGKIVIVMREVPDGLPSTLTAHFGNQASKMKMAANNGAIGLLLVDKNLSFPAGNVSSNVAMSPDKSEAMSWNYSGKDIRVMGSISLATLRLLFRNSGKNLQALLNSLKQKKNASCALPGSLQLSFESIHEDIVSDNVAGMIPGKDPVLKNEYVVHTAHLDHLGIGRAVNGDSIYNGAHDNASGISSLLEIARIYKQARLQPKRSVLFVLVTAEEMGLLGSSYFASNPSVPKNNIVANVNTDMPTVIAPLLSVVPLGAEHSSLLNDVRFATNYLGLDIEKDPEPEQNRFIRSDQYSFVMQGIPALHVKYGNKMITPGISLTTIVQPWRAKYYHQPADGIDGIFDFEAAKRYILLNFLIGYSIAQNKTRPSWNNGDVFGNIVTRKEF